MEYFVISRFCRVFLFTLVMITIPTGCESNLTDREYLQKARNAHESGDERSSIIHLKNALVANPQNTEARWLLGLVYLELGQGKNAEKELRQAHELGLPLQEIIVSIVKAMLLGGEYDQLLEETENLPGMEPDIRAHLHVLRGDTFYRKSNIEEAKKEYERALSLDTSLQEAKIGFARIALFDGKPDEARLLIEAVQSEEPDMPDAWRVLGDLERSLGNASAAETSYGKAIELSLNNANDYLSRAVIRIYSGKYDEAEDDIRSASENYGVTPRVQYVQGLLDFNQGEFDQAQNGFQKVVENQPGYMPAYFYLGASNFRLGMYKQAVFNLEKYLTAFPESIKARILLSYVYLRDDDTLKAAHLLESVRSEQPDNQLVLRLLGNIYLASGQIDKGTLYLKNAVAQQPDSSDLRMNVGLSLMTYGSPQEGLEQLENAFVLDPDDKAAKNQLVLAYLQARKFNEAIEMATQMSEERPDDPAPLDFLALAYVGLGEPEKAESYFKQALQVSPGDPVAGLSLARKETSQGNIEKARVLYQQVLLHNPDHQQALTRLARLEARHGSEEETRKNLEKMIEVYPENAEGYILLAQYYLRFGRVDDAMKSISTAAEIHPRNPSVLATLGEVQLQLGRLSSADNTFSRLISLQPNNAQAHFLMATVYSEKGDVEKTRYELEQALKIDPGHFQAKLASIRLLSIMNEREKAQRLLSEMIMEHPDDPYVLDLQGLYLLSENRPDEAAKVYEQVATIQPSSLNTINLARAQWQAGDHDVSIATMKQWIYTHPEDVSVNLALANTYLSNKKEDLAIQVYSNVLKQAPNNNVALNNLAWLLRNKKPDLAMKYAKQAVEITNYAPTSADTLGVLLLEQGETEKALRVLEDASKKAPANPSISYHLAMALGKAGHTAKAVERLHELIETNPDYSGLNDARKLLRELDK